jgi:predicted negative regulator of RcsB-dependent stress response
MLNSLQSGDEEAALHYGVNVVEQYSDSVYAVLAALGVAKLEVSKGDTDAATQRLKWALERANEDGLKHVVQLRLARLLLDQGKLDEALQYANPANMGTFKSSYSHVKGDIYLQKGDQDMARMAYQAALQDQQLSPQTRNLVQMKLDDLGGAEDMTQEASL